MTAFDGTNSLENDETAFDMASYGNGVDDREVVHGIVIDRSRDNFLTPYGKAMMVSDYLLPGESFQDRFACVARAYADNDAHAQRVYDYISRLWFMPATPILSNGGSTRGLPISCYLSSADDSLASIVEHWNENIWLAAKGGGIGSYWGNLRGLGEKVGLNGKTSGIIPFIRVMDSLTLAISQGSLRRGSAAVYLPINHPEIEEFIEIRRPTGGDPNRKALNLHNAVVVSDAFMEAVEKGLPWNLLSPKDGHVVKTIGARELWIRLLTARIETGEPYILFSDAVNRAIPEHHKKSGLFVKQSNLCSEIVLPTGKDHLGNERTAVCCLSSLNLDKWDEWQSHPLFIEDVMRFLDNVLQSYIDNAPDTMSRAKYAAMRERSVGLGVMGFHSLLQQKEIPFESPMARILNKKVFKYIREKADEASYVLAVEKGACPDAAEHGIMERFSNKLAIAPTASISVICGQSSPGIEPFAANAYNEKRKIGSFEVKNAYLAKVLERHGKNNASTWSSIITNKGSVQHLDFLSAKEKAVFKTAFELDQTALIELAADRTPYICQAQSLNIFLPGDVHKKILHDVHMLAWKRGVKSLYYCRSLSIQRAQNVSDATGNAWKGATSTFNIPATSTGMPVEANKYEVCEACQ
jgi:ribonucleoside-diphosphate reductase alpha chain